MTISNDYDLFHRNINKKIKVLEVINSLKIGGAELLLRNFLIEARKSNQFIVDVCTLYAANNSKNIEDIREKNIRIWPLGLKNKYSLLSVGKIKKIIEKGNYDIVHVHLFPASAVVALCSLFLPNHTHYILTEHSTFNRRRRIKFFKILDNLIYNRYFKIICISKSVKNSLIKWIPSTKNRIKIIPNGIPIGFKSKDNSVIKKYDVLFVGRLVRQKGINFLLEAVKIFQKKYKKTIRVAIVGEGPLKNELVKMCKKLKIMHSVKLLGFKNDIDRIMKSSKILALPSQSEGFGIVLLEAMKNKLPIIATNVGGIPEIITNGHEGILIPKKNPKILANSIKIILENSELRKQFIHNAYKKVENQYSIEKYAHSMFNLYSDILQKDAK